MASVALIAVVEVGKGLPGHCVSGVLLENALVFPDGVSALANMIVGLGQAKSGIEIGWLPPQNGLPQLDSLEELVVVEHPAGDVGLEFQVPVVQL